MNEPVFIRKYFNKCAKLNDCFYFSFIYLSDFGNSNNLLYPVKGCSNNFSILSEDIYISMTIYFLNNYCSSGYPLNLLDYFSAGTDQCSDQFFGNGKHFNPWGMWFQFTTRF